MNFMKNSVLLESMCWRGNLLNLDNDQSDKDINKSIMSDSIQMYLKIGQYPLIHASEEKELAKRIEHGDLEAKIY